MRDLGTDARLILQTGTGPARSENSWSWQIY